MREMGVNVVRLAHYPQAEYFYDLMDRNGIVTWAEIPFVGPGGYADKGYVDQESFKANGREQLREMIRQHYNHPSIMMWGIFNEIKEDGDNPVEYVKELNTLAHASINALHHGGIQSGWQPQLHHGPHRLEPLRRLVWLYAENAGFLLR